MLSVLLTLTSTVCMPCLTDRQQCAHVLIWGFLAFQKTWIKRLLAWRRSTNHRHNGDLDATAVISSDNSSSALSFGNNARMSKSLDKSSSSQASWLGGSLSQDSLSSVSSSAGPSFSHHSNSDNSGSFFDSADTMEMGVWMEDWELDLPDLVPLDKSDDNFADLDSDNSESSLGLTWMWPANGMPMLRTETWKKTPLRVWAFGMVTFYLSGFKRCMPTATRSCVTNYLMLHLSSLTWTQ